MEQAKLPNIIILHRGVLCAVCTRSQYCHGRSCGDCSRWAQGAQQRILGQVAALAVRTLDLKWISLEAASLHHHWALWSTSNVVQLCVHSHRFMLTPAAVSVDTMAMSTSMCGTVSGSEGSLFHDPTSSERRTIEPGWGHDRVLAIGDANCWLPNLE